MGEGRAHDESGGEMMRETKTCIQCGKVFEKPSGWSKGAWESVSRCSQACRTAALTGRIYKPLLARLEEHVSPEPNTGCWFWMGAVNTYGYPHSYMGGKCYMMHRVSYEAHKGPIPKGLLACHHCDTPLCINPDHIFIGTEADNSADCARKGRASRGEKHPFAKLNEAKVREMRAIHAAGGTQITQLARMFGVSRPVAQKVCQGKLWRHV
jgi:hypothetical protein